MSDSTLEFEKENYMESGRKADSGKRDPGQVVSVACEGGEAKFSCDNGAALWVTALEPKVLRFRFIPHGRFGDGFSYAVADGALERRVELGFAEEGDRYRLSTGALVVYVTKDGLRLRIEDADGGLISEDESGFHWEDNDAFGGRHVYHSRYLQSNEHFYGLGDKSCHPDLRGKRFEIWGSDTYGYGMDTDPLYKNVPFFVGLSHGRAYGIFFDSSFRSFFDFGKERSNVASFWAQGGEMDFYFMFGPEMPDVSRRFASVTGTPELPPLWAMGYHQCKWSYRTEGEVKKIASSFREQKIPCDAIYVDIDYMDGFRCFTWNHEAFPDPGGCRGSWRRTGFGWWR